MIMEYIKITLASFFLMLSISCSGQSYYKKVNDNIKEFTQVIDRLIQKHTLELDDSLLLRNTEVIKFRNKCLYKEQVNDPLVRDLMSKYNLNRICLTKYNNEFFDSAITFHKDYAPFFGKAIVITYDFGKSRLRDLTNQGNEVKDEKVKIINSKFLYRVRSKPSFGE